MDFGNGIELLKICREQNLPISQVMLNREVELGQIDRDTIIKKLGHSLEIMKSGAKEPIKKPQKSLGGLIGGEAKRIMEFKDSLGGKALCGEVLTRAIAYSMAILEVNGTMGLIVAAPTAGSSGVVPGALISIGETLGFSDEKLIEGLLNASALGYIMMKNASVSGAEAGCQAEVGAASAMAASALVELLGGTPEMCLSAAAMAISNLLGMVCDPILGLVEAPCQSRNAIGVSNGFVTAQLALSGIKHIIPFDEMVEAMYRVGRALPCEFRETALGGNAATPTACSMCYGS